MNASRRFVYDDLCVGVGAADPEHLVWLEEFLQPAFASVDKGSADCSVTLVFDEPAYKALERRGPDPDGREAVAFVFDQGLVRLPVWTAPGQEHVFFDSSARVFYLLSPDRSQVRILCGVPSVARRITLMRVVREFVMSHTWTRGPLVLHAAAFGLARQGVLIAGPKGAGKTSLLMSALGCAGARFIANDRVVIDVDGKPPRVQGMPTVVTITDRTVMLFPELERRRVQRGYHERVALHEVQAPRPERAPGERVTLTPAQLCALLDVPMVGEGRARLVLFPRVHDGVRGLRVCELSPQLASERLRQSVFAVDSACRTSEVFALPVPAGTADPATADEMCAALAADLRSFDCQMGGPAESVHAGLAAFLHEVLPGA